MGKPMLCPFGHHRPEDYAVSTLGLGQNASVYHLLKMITLLISLSLFSPAFQNKTKQCTNHPLALSNSTRQQCLGTNEIK